MHEIPKEEDSSWLIVIQSPSMLKQLHLHGRQIVGLDSVFKWLYTRTPVWLLTMVDAHTNQGIVGAIIMAATSSTALLAKGLAKIKARIVCYVLLM